MSKRGGKKFVLNSKKAPAYFLSQFSGKAKENKVYRLSLTQPRGRVTQPSTSFDVYQQGTREKQARN